MDQEDWEQRNHKSLESRQRNTEVSTKVSLGTMNQGKALSNSVNRVSEKAISNRKFDLLNSEAPFQGTLQPLISSEGI